MALDGVRAWPASVWVLVASNLVPLLGVLLLGWDLGLVLLLYWAESAVILAFSLAKLASTAGLAALFLVPFFMVHAGGFMAVHLVFLLTLFVDRPDAGWDSLAADLGLGLLALAASHGYSFWANFRRRRETYAKPQEVMTGFYGRVVVLHLTILFGGWVVLLLDEPAGALALLVLLKTAADVAAHLRERRRHPPAAAPVQAAPS